MGDDHVDSLFGHPSAGHRINLVVGPHIVGKQRERKPLVVGRVSLAVQPTVHVSTGKDGHEQRRHEQREQKPCEHATEIALALTTYTAGPVGFARRGETGRPFQLLGHRGTTTTLGGTLEAKAS